MNPINQIQSSVLNAGWYLTYDAYGESLESEKEKELEIKKLEQRYEQDMKQMREEMETKFQQILAKIDFATLK